MRTSRRSRAAPAPAARTAAVAGLAVLAVLAGLVAGCGTDTNIAADPSAHSGQAADQFDAFPEPATWNLTVGPTYTAILGPLSGTERKKTFTITGRPNLVFWLGCLGTGTARLSSPDMTLDWRVQCGVNREPAAINVDPTHARPGKMVEVRLTVPAGDRWSFRVDAPVTPAP
jgi:hypothetical protein